MNDRRILRDSLSINLQLADLFQRVPSATSPAPELSLGDREIVGMPGVVDRWKGARWVPNPDPNDDVVAIDLDHVTVAWTVSN
jgi:hypothetical protein